MTKIGDWMIGKASRGSALIGPNYNAALTWLFLSAISATST